MVTDEQVKLLRKKLMENKSQEAAAASAAMSVRSARKWKDGPLPSEQRRPRSWRTRQNPFEDVWDVEIVPLLKADAQVQAKAVLDEMMERYPGRFEPGQVRTLQRHVQAWRALHGPERDVVFPQEHPDGRELAFDFTHADALGVTLAGVPFPHLLFVARLSASKWTFAEVALGETWEALCHGLQEALWALGGCPEVARHDNLSAATRDLKAGRGRALTERYAALLAHYGIRSSRIKPGRPNENGVVEKANDLLVTALDQALRLRGSRDFASRSDWERFVARIVERLNAARSGAIDAEKAVLRPLPTGRVPDHVDYDVEVRSWSTIRVRGHVYSVPSRLIGHTVTARVHPERIEVFFRGQRTEGFERVRGKGQARIDYRHIIWSLVQKPGAFARYRYREELFPTLTFRRAYDALVSARGERADVEYVRVLHLAASTMECQVEAALTLLLEAGTPFSYGEVKALAAPEPVTVPHVAIGTPDLARYDRLLTGVR